jgi:hypothetical protein
LSAPLVTFTAVRYRGAAAAWGALHMATQRRLLARTPGLAFSQLLGMGSGIGFSAVPDLGAWGLVAVWRTPDHFDHFDADSAVMRQYRRRGSEVYTLLLRPFQAHGRWGGTEPFGTVENAAPPPAGAPVVVLTRAAIRLRRAARFWARVPAVDRTLHDHPELVLTFGVGEVPWVRQATLSVWRSAAGMRAWAYATPEHAEVVRRTREEGWYSEELFARFSLVATRGSWQGADPLAPLLP